MDEPHLRHAVITAYFTLTATPESLRPRIEKQLVGLTNAQLQAKILAYATSVFSLARRRMVDTENPAKPETIRALAELSTKLQATAGMLAV